MGFMNRATKQITITRGDSGRAKILLRMDGEVYEMNDGDQINFGVKKKYSDTECLVEKTYTENPFVLAIDPEDTKPLDFGSYVWDLQLVTADGYTKTLIAKKDFKVTEEVV